MKTKKDNEEERVSFLIYDLIRYRRNWDRVHPFFWAVVLSFVLVFIGALLKGVSVLIWMGGFILFLFAACVGIWLKETLP